MHRPRFDSSGGSVCTRCVVTKGRPSLVVLGFWPFLTACAPHNFLSDTPSPNHGCQVSTTETSGSCYLFLERGHRCLECHGGYDANQDCFLFRQHDPDNDQGTFPLLLQRSTPGSRADRTQWLMNWITSSSGYPVLMYVGPSTGGWVEED